MRVLILLGNSLTLLKDCKGPERRSANLFRSGDGGNEEKPKKRTLSERRSLPFAVVARLPDQLDMGASLRNTSGRRSLKMKIAVTAIARNARAKLPKSPAYPDRMKMTPAVRTSAKILG